MSPVIVHLGPFQVTWYGVLIVAGAVLAAWISTKEAARRGEDPEHVWNLLTLVLIFGIIGARLYHVFSSPTGNFAGWAYYARTPSRSSSSGMAGSGDWASSAGFSAASWR